MKLFGLIGYPLTHSFSEKYFSEKFKNEKINSHYDLFELARIEDFASLINEHQFSGLNVTIPHKESIIKYLSSLDETANEIAAVNVIKFIKNSDKTELKGYNTDVVGFQKSIEPLIQPHHSHALILGTGGASKAVDYALKKMGISTKLVSRFPADNQYVYQDITQEVLDQYRLIINTTPLGTYPQIDGKPDIPYHYLGEKHLLYDLVYNPVETQFLIMGKKFGATTKNGEEMLVLQAEEAWKVWNNEY